MKKSVLLAASLVAGGLVVSPVLPLRAQEASAQVQPTFPSHSAAREAGEKLFAEKKYKEARAAFTAAGSLAKTPTEKADALTGVARTYEKEVVLQEIRSGKSAVRRQTFTDYPAARLAYEEVEKLADLPTERKLEARLAIANTYILEGKLSVAREEYTKVLGTEGATPTAKAIAYTARANTYLKGLFVSSQDFTTAFTDAETAVKQEPVPDPVRADALLVLADLNARALKGVPALEHLAALVALPKATDDQKARALMMTGNYHMRAKDPSRARVAYAQVPSLTGAKVEDRMQAHQALAQIYLGEKKIDAAVAELDRAAQLPDLTVFQKAELYENMGDVQFNAQQFAGAREAYAKILALKEAGPLRHKDAILRTGHTYIQEKQPAKAREEWEKLAAGKDVNATEALHQIALSHAGEKDYPAARAALERWTALPVDNYWKEDAWLLLGRLYEQEHNWTAARESLQKLIGEPKARPSRRVQAVVATIRTYESEKNTEAAQQAFELLPAAFQFMGQLSPAEASALTQFRSSITGQLTKLAAERGKEKTTLPSALSLYRIVEKIEILDGSKLEATLAMADLLLKHDMPAEAKVEYMKVFNSPRASNAQLQRARTNLKTIEDKEKAATSN